MQAIVQNKDMLNQKKWYVKRITFQTTKFDFKICASPNVLYLPF